MNEALANEIEVSELAGGVLYRFPRRDLGGLRFLGCLFLVFGLGFAGFAITWMGFMAGMFWGGGNNAFNWIGVAMALFGIPFVLAGLAIMGVGLAILMGRSEVELREGKVRAIERAGPFHYSWFRPVERIRRFVVHSGGVKVNDRPVQSGPLADLAAIQMDCGDEKKPALLAPGYPRAWLVPLANDLSRRCQLQEFTAGSEPAAIPVVEEREGETDLALAEWVDRPAGSDVTLEEDATGVTLTVPPGGRKASKGLFGFSIIWLVFMAIFTAIVLGIFLFAGGQPQGDPEAIWIFAIVIPIFWLVGAGLLLGALNMSKRRAVLAVVGDRLMVLQTGIFGGKRREWARDEIDRITAGPSGMKVNGVDIIELQVHPRSGWKVGLLNGRDTTELHWMACVLRQALKIDQRREATGSSGPGAIG